MDILLYAMLEQVAAQKSNNKDLEELLREMVLRIKENTKQIKQLEKKVKK